MYAATIPGQDAGLLVRYKIAASYGGVPFSLPAGDASYQYEGYVVKNPAVTSALPIVEWFMDCLLYTSRCV